MERKPNVRFKNNNLWTIFFFFFNTLESYQLLYNENIIENVRKNKADDYKSLKRYFHFQVTATVI